MQARLKAIARILASFVMIGAIFYFYRHELDDVLIILKKADVVMIGLVFAGWLLAHMIFSWRLQMILAVQDVSLRIRDAFAVVMAGMFFNNFIPTIVGGDVAKGIYLTRFIKRERQSYSSIFLDRLIGIVTLMLLGMGALGAFHVGFYDVKAKYSFMVFAFIGIFGFVFFLNRNLAKRVSFLRKLIPFERFQTMSRDFYDAIHGYRKHPVRLMLAFFVSFLGQASTIVCVYYLSKAIGVDVPLHVFFVFFPLISFASLAPSVNGLGAREAMFLFYLSSWCGADGALAISLLVDLLFILSGVFGGLFVGVTGKIELKNNRADLLAAQLQSDAAKLEAIMAAGKDKSKTIRQMEVTAATEKGSSS